MYALDQKMHPFEKLGRLFYIFMALVQTATFK
jgi:hypothetical protein